MNEEKDTRDSLEIDKDMRLMASIENTLKELGKEPEEKETFVSALNKLKRKFDSVVGRR